MRQPGLWRARMAVAVLGTALATLLVPSPAHAASSDELRFFTLANSLRASVGVPALTFDDTLASVARTWAGTMAANGTISHNPNLASQLTGWIKLDENVGMGPDVDTIHQALVASHPHYVNLTDTEVSRVGVGVVRSGTTVFVVEDFMGPRPATATAPAPSPAASAPAPAPAPTPKPAARAATPVTPAPVPAPSSTTAAPAVPAPAAAAAADPPPSLSPALTLALELTRGWERADR